MNFSRRKLIQLPGTAIAASLFAPHVARAASKKLRIGHNNTQSSALQAASVAFQQYVTEKTDGRYVVEVFPNSQIGNDTQMVKAVVDGTLDMTVCASSILGIYDRDLELAEIPYLFESVTSARKALDGNLGAHYTDLLAKNSLTAIGWGEVGVRHVTANKPVRTVVDLKGLKIRVQTAKIHIESFTGLGAQPSALTFNELPEALRTGRFEAQENPVGIIIANDFIPKYQSHLSLTGHIYSPAALLFSSDVLEDMPAPDRAILKAGGVLAAKATRDFNEEAAKTGLGKLKASGMTIISDVDRAGFQKAMEGLAPRLASVVGADAISRVRNLIA